MRESKQNYDTDKTSQLLAGETHTQAKILGKRKKKKL
jgi:hypothetical protein